MPPTTYPFKRRIIRRRVWISGAFVALAVIYLALSGWSARNWADVVVVIVLALYAVRFLRDLAHLGSGARTAITIDDDGISDPKLGRARIPWTAIRQIRVSDPASLGGQLFLIADPSTVPPNAGNPVIRMANWMRGARVGQQGADFVLAMTPVLALDASLDEILADIRSRVTAASIPIVPSSGSKN